MNTDANITLTANGASEASAALDQVSGSFQKIGAQSDALKGKFQERFQHIGLNLFAGDALRAAGLGNETRMVISSLNMALMEGAAAAGISSGGILLVVTAAAALYGIIEKLVDKHKDETDAVEKLNQQYAEQYKKLEDNIETYTKYSQLSADMPGYLTKWANAEKALADIEKDKLQTGYLKEIQGLNDKIVKQEDSVSATKDEIAANEKSISSSANLYQRLAAQAMGHDTVRANVVKETQTLNEQNKSLDEMKAKLALAEANMNALHAGYVNGEDALKKLTAAQEEWGKVAKETTDAENKQFEEWGKAHADALQNALKDENDYYQELAKTRAKNSQAVGSDIELEEKERKTMYDAEVKIGKGAYDSIVNTQSQAFAKMIVDGESFSKATAHMWKDLATQVIAQIEAMIAKYLVMMALTGGTGSFATGSAMGAIFGGAHAEGGSVMVNQPTMFLAGEGGEPEIATFTPLSRMGGAGIGAAQYMGSGSGSSLSIGSIVTYVTGVQDPSAIADQVGQAIVSRIRGRGDLNFTRS